MDDESSTMASLNYTSDGRGLSGCEHQVDLKRAMNAVFDMAAVVDSKGIVVMANEEFGKALRSVDSADVVGRRIGSIARCSRHLKSNLGCGKTSGCEYCGVNKAIKECLSSGQPATGEASLVLNEDEELIGANLAVRTTPLVVNGVPHVLVSLRDISARKTKNYIDVKLIHFLADQIGGIQGLSGFLADHLDVVAHRELALCIVGASSDALCRIEEYRQLVDAESGDVKPVFSDISLCDLVVNLELLANSSLKVRVSVDNRCAKDSLVNSDTILLQASLVRIMEFAAESFHDVRDVHLRVSKSKSEYIFAVHHRSVLDPNRKYAIFSRWSETDSGCGGSLGAYLSRLYVERYLGGEVSCRSSEEFGTVYTIRIPVNRHVRIGVNAA